jgi:hypothetical protein
LKRSFRFSFYLVLIFLMRNDECFENLFSDLLKMFQDLWLNLIFHIFLVGTFFNAFFPLMIFRKTTKKIPWKSLRSFMNFLEFPFGKVLNE